jgi:hypothetical protein
VRTSFWLAAVSLLSLASCDLYLDTVQDDCAGGVDVQGAPSQMDTPTGDNGSFYLAGPAECQNSPTTFALTTRGQIQADSNQAYEALSRAVDSANERGISVYGPGFTTVPCIEGANNPYEYVLQVLDWNDVDQVIEEVVISAASADLQMKVGIEVGLPIACPL